MKKLRFILGLFLLAVLNGAAFAQRATVTATITSAWAGGSVVATFVPQGGGTPSPISTSGTINSAGAFSLNSAWQNTYSAYVPSVTTFNICVGSAPATCYSTTVQITSSSQDISSAFSGAPTPPSGGATSATVNGGSALTSLNLNATTPAAPGGSSNCVWQISGANASCSVPTSSTVHAVAPDGEWAFLPATSSLVTETDITGNGNALTFTGSGMTRATRGGVTFTDAGYLLSPISVWKSLVVRMCPYNYPAGSGTLSGANPMGVWGSNGTGTGNQVSALSTSFQTGTNSWWVFTPSFYDTGNNTSGADIGFGCHTYVYTLDTNERIWVDGIEVSYANQAAPPSSQLTGGHTYGLGLALGSSSYYFSGTITYAYVYKTTVLNPGQVAQETAYVAALRPPPLYDPYTNLMPGTRVQTLVAAGDSKTQGIGGGTPYTSGITFNNTYTVVNMGAGGETSPSDSASHPYRIWPKLSLHGRNVVVLWLGSNDIGNSLTAAQSWANQLITINNDLAQGIEVFFINQDGGSAGETAYAVYFRQQAYKMGAHFHLIDLPQDAIFGATGASSNLTYYEADAVHMTNAGYARVKTAVQNAVNSVDGSSVGSPDLLASNAVVETTANNYVEQTCTTACTTQLPDCIYMTGWTRTIVNASAGADTITVSTTGTGSMVGGTTIAQNVTGVFTAFLTATSTGGCYWQRTF